MLSLSRLPWMNLRGYPVRTGTLVFFSMLMTMTIDPTRRRHADSRLLMLQNPPRPTARQAREDHTWAHADRLARCG